MSIIEEIHKNAQEINNFPQQKVYNWANKANGEYNSSIDYLKEYNPKLLEKMFKLLPKEPTRDDVKRCYELLKKPKIIVAHLDCLAHCFSTFKTIKKVVQENNLQDRVIIPKDGEIVSL